MLRFRFLEVIVVIGVIAATAAYFAHRHRIANESLTTLAINGSGYQDGRDVDIQIAGNAFDKTTVVLVCDRLRPIRWGPLAALKSEVSIVTHYPPDSSISGLWIDHRKQRLGNDLLVVYVTESSHAEILAISLENKRPFLADASTLDPLQFLDKWVKSSHGRTDKGLIAAGVNDVTHAPSERLAIQH